MKRQKRERSKRGVAALLAVMLIVSTVLAYAPSWEMTQAAAGDMLDIDGGFERGDWTAKHDDRKILWEQSTEEVRSGNYAARYYYNANGAKSDKYIELHHEAFDVKPNTIYQLTYYIKNVNLTNVHGYMGVYDAETKAWFGGTKVLSEMSVATNNGASEWTKMSAIFTTDGESEKAQIYITMNLNQVSDLTTLTDGASFYMDDISIQNLGSATLEVNLASIVGAEVMEWSATPDGLVGSVETQHVKSHEGLKIASSTGEVGTSFALTSEAVAVESAKTYTLSYYVKTPDFPGVNYGISIYDADNGTTLATNLGAGKTGPEFGTDWVECNGMFTTNSNTKKIKIKISAYTDADEVNGHEVGAAFYVDDIMIEEASEEAINDGAFDGGFDKVYKGNLLNWSAGGGSNGLTIAAGNEAHKGNASLKVVSKTGKSNEYQMIESNPFTLEANKTYDITYYVKSESFVGAVGYACVMDGATELNERGVFIVDDTYATQWRKQITRFTMGDEDKEVYLRFTIRAGEAVSTGAALFIDTVSITEVTEDGANDGSLDGGFERVYNDEFTNWTSHSRNTVSAIVTKDAHSGKHALKFENASTKKGYQEVVSNKYKVKQNTTYDISYFMKNVDFPEGSTGYVAVFDARDTNTSWLGARKDLGNYIITSDFSTEWKRYVGQFTTKEDTTEIVVKFVVSTMGAKNDPGIGRYLLVDDLLIEEYIPETTLIKNPDFERIDLISWRTVRHPQNSDGKVDATLPNKMDAARVEGGQNGDYSLYMQADVKGYVAVLQDKAFEVNPSSTYKFTYYVRTGNAENADAYAMILAYQKDGVTPAIGNYTQTLHTVGNQNEWKRVVTYFTTADNQYYMNVQLCLVVNTSSAGSVPAVAWFDNLTLEQVPTIGEKDNLGFEYIEDETLYDWTYSVLASGADALQLDAAKFGWKMETDNVKEGKKALQVTANSSVGHVLLTSRRLTVKGGSMYKVTYWVNVEGAITSDVNLGAHYTLANGKPASIEWEWTNDNRITGPTNGWKKVTTYITVPSDAKLADIRFTIGGNRTIVRIDDVQLEEYDLDDNQNMSFESGDHNWKISGGDAIIDTEIYHSGSRSLHVTKSSQRDTKVTSMVYIPVEYGDTYLFGGWYKSCNNINSRVRFNLNCYDADGNMLKPDGSRRIILGPEVTGNTDANPSEWHRLMFSGNIPDGTTQVGLEIVVTDGRAEMWFDDLFIRQCNLSDEEMLVDYTTMDQVDDKGDMESVTLDVVSGEASFAAVNGAAVMSIEDDSEAYIAYETDYMLSGNGYRVLLHNYVAEQDATVIIEHYDYRGNHIEEMDTTVTVPASAEWADYELSVVVPSSVVTKICFGSAQAGIYKISQIDIVEVEQEDEAASWVGRWIWYNEDTLINCQYQSRYFRHKFTLEEAATYAPLQITCDDLYTIYVNGKEVGGDMDSSVEEWGTPTTYDLVPYLQKGENVIAIEAYNRVSYGALLYDIRVTMENEEQVYVCSNIDEVVSAVNAAGDWKELNYDDSSWKKPKDYGRVGVSPWGEIFFDASLYADKKIIISSFDTGEAAHTDSTVEIDAVIEIENEFEDNYPFEVNIYKKNTTTLITSSVLEIVDGAQPSEWKVGKNKVTFKMYIPDYLETGNYTLQLSDAYYYLMNEGVIERKFANITVLQANEKQEAAVAEVRTVNGTPTIYINDEVKASILYQEPGGTLWFDVENEAKYMEGTDTEIYVPNRVELWDQYGRNGSLWLDKDTMDWAVLDNVIYSVLSADPDAFIMPTIGVRAPVWWLDQNPEEELLLYDAESGEYIKASVRSESFSSDKWKEASSEVIKEIVEHMMNASYASHIVGCRFVDGDTSEFMTQDVEETIIADFSPASLNGFREYLKEKYQTDSALQEAYHDSNVTFENVTVPTYDDRNRVWLSTDGVSDTIIKDPNEDRWVIDYNYYSGIVSSEMFMSYCSALKEASDGKWLAGGYHGYTWVFAGIGGIARTHPAVDMVLACDDVDLIYSPYVYGERTKGENSPFDAMIDGVQAAGKMYILEVDTRSVYEGSSGNADTDASVGTSYTMADSIASLKRDLSALVAKGAGFWIFNMYGVWWYDDQMLSVIREVKQEMEYSMFMGSETLSDVAVYVDEMNYPYLSNGEKYSATRTYYYLYMWQRRNLATMGTGYDLYNMSDLVNGNMKKEYKINIMLSPYEITSEERAAIESKLKRDDKIIVWVNLSGISDGTKNDMDYLEKITGFDVEYLQTKGAQTGSFVSGHELTEGIEGYIYGDDATGAANGVGPLLYVDISKDSEAVELAECVFDDTKSALVMKDMGDWTSIYSAPMGLPNGFLRNLVKYAGGHIYTDNTSDIVYASSTYLSVYSLYGGERTVTLPEKYSVYDVYEKEYITMNDDTFTFTMEDNQARLFRLMDTDKVAVTAMTRGGHASLDKLGITELALGETYTVTVDVEEGYQLVSVRVDDEEVDITDTITVENIDDTHHIVFETEQIKTYGTYVNSIAVRWNRVLLLLLSIIAGVTVVGTAIEVGVVILKRKRKNSKESV